MLSPDRQWYWDGQQWVPVNASPEGSPMHQRLLALGVLPGSALALALWLWLMAQTPSQSITRYVFYWSTIVVVPGVMIAVPYRVLSRVLRPSTAVLLVVALVGTCALLFVWWFVEALNSLTF